ncbi:hypothetical protein A2U01_0038423, partial [Trifolium medium]|nr:hypothetical protein [Trifolium medium]
MTRQLLFCFILFTSQTFLDTFLSSKGYSFQELTLSESDVPEVLVKSLVFRGQHSRVWAKLPECDLQTSMDSSE